MIYITRHGQTEWNEKNKVMGKVDIPLSKIGLEQSGKLKEKVKQLQIDLIVCSPLLRARQTAEIINENHSVKIIYDDRISERCYGEFEGLNINDFDFLSYWNYYDNKKYKYAENIRDFFARIYEFFDEIIKKYWNKNVLIVTHSGVGLSALCYFDNKIPEKSLIETNSFSNCEIKSFEIN